ncbi:hypothetical protein HHK36_011653 [Tetracentron sinense]|uniref:Uncharacterized protein n=1 Tax=Tetracentron sinense TaxID=13715 RepID=A0A835DKL7_TETSI|nr:hypothetical protein HHK36_011653 [Tetracentron sinense]
MCSRSNELFALFLDETMTYSSAIFKMENEDLKVAQLRKISLLIGKKGSEGRNLCVSSYFTESQNTKWRFGAPPNYDVVNKLFEEGRTKIWPPGSIEEKVQNLVKKWEMEMLHKTCFDGYKTANLKKYRISLNDVRYRRAMGIEVKRSNTTKEGGLKASAVESSRMASRSEATRIDESDKPLLKALFSAKRDLEALCFLALKA